MWRLKSNYLWETGPEEGARPLAKWFTLRAILFYRLLNSLDHSKICMYYSAFERKNCCPARLPSAFWTLWCIWGMLPFRIRLKSYFSAWGQMKWVGEKEGAFLASLPRTFHRPSLQRRLSSAKYTHIYIYISEGKLHEHVSMYPNWKKEAEEAEVQLRREGTFTCMRNYSRTSGGVQMQRWNVWGVWCQTPAGARWKDSHLSRGRWSAG